MINPLRFNIPLLLMQRELIDTEHVMQSQRRKEYSALIRSYGSLAGAKHAIGTNTGLYTSVFRQDELPGMNPNAIPNSTPSTDRFVNADGIEPDLIGRLSRKGNLLGPFNTATMNYDEPYVPQTFGIRIERSDSHYFTYGPTDNLKALMILYGDKIFEHLEAYDDKGEPIDLASEISFDRKNENHLLEVMIEGEFRGHAGEYTIGSASNMVATEYAGVIRQPLMLANGIYLFRDNALYSNGSPRKQKQIGARPEFKKNNELTKHDIAFMLGLKKGVEFMKKHEHNLRIEFPKGHPVDNINEQKCKILTLYEALENPFLPGTNMPNKIFRQVNGELARLYYIENLPERQVDFYIMNNFWDLIATPEILWDTITMQAGMQERYKRTAHLAGQAKRDGTPLINSVNMPIPTANIKVSNGEHEMNAVITIEPSRAHKLHRDNNTNSTCYGGYTTRGYKPKLIQGFL